MLQRVGVVVKTFIGVELVRLTVGLIATGTELVTARKHAEHGSTRGGIMR